MRESRHLGEKEKKLLNALGSQPDISQKELLKLTTYRRTSSVSRKIEQFKEENYLSGPTYAVDLGKLSKNPVSGFRCRVEYEKDIDTVIEYLQIIEPLIWVYPVLSSHKGLLNTLLLSSDERKLESLLQLLKDNNIITDYGFRVSRYHLKVENPNFYGDPLPSLDNLLEPCEFPDLSYGCHSTTWNECDIRTLTYVVGGFESIKLMDILRNERKLHNKEWTYEQIKYSFEKMSRNKLISKFYLISPFPHDECTSFYLFIRADDRVTTQRIVYNFARGGRIHREYGFCGDWGMMGCISHPQFVVDLMHKLDVIEEIKWKELYILRSFTSGVQYAGKYSEFDYFDVETQTLEYPYDVFREKIEKKLANK